MRIQNLLPAATLVLLIILNLPLYATVDSCNKNLPIPESLPGLGIALDDSCVISGIPGDEMGIDVELDAVEIIILHPRVSDLIISLESPNGVVVTLSSLNGGATENYGDSIDCPDNTTIFRRNAANGAVSAGSGPFLGAYRPDGDLDDFNDEDAANGTWILHVKDEVSGGTGTLQYWSLDFDTVCVEDETPPIANCPCEVISTDSVISYTVSTADNCAGETTSQTSGLASGSVFPPGITLNVFVVTDGDGNTSTCSFICTYVDEPTLEVEINSTTTGPLAGLVDKKDFFGKGLTSLGDFDGDGNPDLVAGAPGDDDGFLGAKGKDNGAIWILFMDSTRNISSFQKISANSGNLNIELEKKDRFGTSVDTIGDLNTDGIMDLIVGAPGDDDGSGGKKNDDRGAVYILFMESDGTVKNTAKLSDDTGNFNQILEKKDNFGEAVSTAGDLNGDGMGDIIVGAFGDDDGAKDAGAIYVIFLSRTGVADTSIKISAAMAALTDTIKKKDGFGSAVEFIGSLEVDTAADPFSTSEGTPVCDIVVGAPGDDAGGKDKGAVWVLIITDNAVLQSFQKLSATDGNFNGTLNKKDKFGAAIALLGDCSPDGIVDIAIGVPGNDDGGKDKGAVFLVQLTTDGTVLSSAKISEGNGDFVGPLAKKDEFGSGLQSIVGGCTTILTVSSPKSDKSAKDAGSVWTFPITCTGVLTGSSPAVRTEEAKGHPWNFPETRSENETLPISTDFKNGIKLFPNPFSDHIAFSLEGEEPSAQRIRVIDVYGKVVTNYNQELHAGSTYILNTKDLNLAPGFYFFSFQSKSKNYTIKALKVE